jgi:dTDP-4-dehydrorhamnose reductase
LNKIHRNKNDIRILITGITSIHGWPIYQKVAELFSEKNILAIGPPKMKHLFKDGMHQACITDRKRLEKLNSSFQATHVIHCGGVCDLDVCEARPDWAYRMNVGGAKVMMDLFHESCHMTYISSDLVFSGDNTPKGGYCETHFPDPISVVGQTYLEAEKVISQSEKNCIIRLALPLGRSFTGGKGAEDWIESRLRRSLPVTLFFDEVRSCISCEELAEKVLMLAMNRANGIFHCGGRKSMSLYEIGKQVFNDGYYSPSLLKKASRLDDIGGPPRVGDVTLDSLKLEKFVRGVDEAWFN